MQILTIEWRHFVKEGATCRRCTATGKILARIVAELRAELAPRAIRVDFVETLLATGEIPQSNLILINGVPLEELLAGAQAAESPCASCACLAGRETSCRTVEYEGQSYEEIPEVLIRIAVDRALAKSRQ